MPQTRLSGREYGDGGVNTIDIADLAVTDAKIAASNKDGLPGMFSMRTLGIGAQQAAAGNDVRFSDARTPTAHTHGNISNTGSIGITSGLPIITGASGLLQVGSFGSTAGTFAQGNDGRFIDARNTIGGVLGSIPYQSALNTTAMLAPGTINQILKSNGASAPSWQTLDMSFIPDAAFKKSTRVASTVNLAPASFTAGVMTGPVGVLTIDGIAVALNDRVLLKDQTSTLQNGIYFVSTLGTAVIAWVLTRALDADTSSEIAGAMVNVDSGTTNGGLLFDTDFKTTDTINSTGIIFNRILDTGLASSVVGSALGVAAIGTSLSYARADHVHLLPTPATIGSPSGSGNSTGTNTGDETLATIKTKLGITTLSGSNTGDQVTISGNAGSATILQNARLINGVSFNGSANITITAAASDVSAWAKAAVKPSYTKAEIGLNLVDNTADSSKSVNYANYAGNLPTAYSGSAQTNPQVYFNGNIGLKVAMTGAAGIWSDTLWINGYSGADVKNMCALHFQRNGTPRAYISTQLSDATAYGTQYELISAYNIGSQSVSYASNAGSANAADVYAWAKAAVKPTYDKTEVGLNLVDNTADASKSVSYAITAKRIEFLDGPRTLADRLPNSMGRSVNFDFVNANILGGTGSYGGVMSFSPWDGTSPSTGDSSYQLAFLNETGVNGSGIPGLKIRKGIDTSWGSWYTLLHSGNFTSYTPSPIGVGASGTWPINITGYAPSSGSIESNPNRTDANPYPIVWTNGGAFSPNYSCSAVTITSSIGRINASSFAGAGTGLTGTASGLSIGGSSGSTQNISFINSAENIEKPIALGFTVANGPASVYVCAGISVNPALKSITADLFKKAGGTSAQYLMADGSVTSGSGGWSSGVAFSINGYQKFNNGLIIQWGSGSVSGTTAQNNTFPITFPNICLNVSATSSQQVNTYTNVNVTSMTVSGFCARKGTTSDPTTISWIAIGY